MQHNDLSIVIQGPLNNTSLSYLDYYKTLSNDIIISYWDNSDEQLLNNINLSNIRLYKQPLVDPKIPTSLGIMMPGSTFYYALHSTNLGIQNSKNKFTLKIRSDEHFGNLDPLIKRFDENTTKFVTTNVFSHPFHSHPFHLSDHVFISQTDILQQTYKLLTEYYDGKDTSQYSVNFKLWPGNAAEQILCKAWLYVQGITDLTRYTLIKYFDILDVNLLKPILLRYNHLNIVMTDYNGDFMSKNCTDIKEL